MLSREEIIAIHEQGPDATVALVERLITAFQQQIEQLNARIKELEDRLALNSRNSSKPPSSNTPAQRPKSKSSRTPSGKKPGAQQGHPGKTLKMNPTPDRVVHHSVSACHNCGDDLTQTVGQETLDQRQVFDLPPLKIDITEHRCLNKICSRCQAPNSGQFPSGVMPGAQYGPNLKSLLVYLVEYHLLPWQRSCEMIGDLFGQIIAEGTICSAINQCADALEGPEEQIKEAIKQAKVAHFDETGLYVAGRREWLHVASTSQLTHYGSHAKRGADATKEIGILTDFTGRAMHDAWSPYFNYSCAHGLCNAHHLRELTFIDEQMGQAWAGELKDLLTKIKQAVEQASEQGLIALSKTQQRRFEKNYDQLIAKGLGLPENKQPPPSGKRGRTKQNKAKNLLDRLLQHKSETLAFMYDFSVPFDNNQAERDLRMIKVQQKVSGCFRSSSGAKAFCRIRGYISTVKKQGRNVLAALSSVFAGSPLSPLPEG
jgi:transposase